ncbi:MAG TPA: DUF5679 domain-containing protein [Nitrososphaeraceae archaeon]|nr:DUF5679 domain-containing protein [Nitrososphaeraceae archaeon]
MSNFETYCIKCKKNTIIINNHFQRLANYRAIINGNCSICNSKLIKGKVMPNSSASKKFIKMKKKLLLSRGRKK